MPLVMVTDSRDASDLLAAEFVLGSLDAGQFRIASQRFHNDRGFARLADRWSERLFPLAEALAPEAPEEGLWERIEGRLTPQENSTAAAASISAGPWPRLFGWGAVAVAAALALALVTPGELSRQQEFAVARLQAENGLPSWTFRVDHDDGSLAVRRQGAAPLRPDQSLELWLVTEEGGVESLGLLPQAAEVGLPVMPAAFGRLAPGATLAISREPFGGSPSGQPSGPVIASAKLSLP